MQKDEIRDRLIELLTESNRVVIDECRKHRLCQDCPVNGLGVKCRQVMQADLLLANGVTVQEWIPVSERLPKESGYYLVHHKRGLVFIRLYNERCGDMFAKFGDDPVTHWMPLPEPPKENDND